MNRLFVFLISFSFFLFSCTKKEGEGGTATIKGKVIVKLCSDDFETIYAEFPDEEQDVYIVYGDDDFYGDKVETHYDGSFQFSYLRKGNYKIYVYSDDETGESVSGVKPLIQEINIDKNGEIKELSDFVIYNQVTNYEGSSTITGKVFAYDWNSELTILKDTFYLRDEWVYIARRADNYYFDRIRTNYDGAFVFPSLPKGAYEVYTYGRDITGQDPQDLIPYIVDVDIIENRQNMDVGRIEIIY
jgi:hypothetical protein